MTRSEIRPIITAFVRSRLTNSVRPSPATDSAGAPSSQSKAPARPTNSARDQWIVDEIRKAEGQI